MSKLQKALSSLNSLYIITHVSNMQSIQTALEGVQILIPKVFKDSRGFFLETYHQKQIEEALGFNPHFVQDNHSRSVKHVLRGLHYQTEFSQGKLVRVTRGEIFDVAVDLRQNSAQFGKWIGVTLSESNQQMIWIPPGFAHGFLTLSDVADVCYKVTNFYHPESDRTLIWNDPEVGIQWPISEKASPFLSEKDLKGKFFKDAEHFIN